MLIKFEDAKTGEELHINLDTVSFIRRAKRSGEQTELVFVSGSSVVVRAPLNDVLYSIEQANRGDDED